MEDPRRGRPRDAGVDEAVIDAALELVAEVGPAAVSVDAIAARAGVSKASIYRRWDCKASLISEGVAQRMSSLEIPLEGTIRDILVATLKGLRHFLADTKLGCVFPWLVGEVATRSEIGRAYAATVIQPRRSMMVRVFEAAIDRGELRSDLDPELCTDMVLGSMIVAKLLHSFDELDDDRAEKVVDALLRGWTAT